jgi:hypothetical protein
VKRHHRQAGITLVVSLIMLIVLTLLVVSAIRFGNINLKISGNAQTEAEAAAAVQVAIEKTLVDIAAAAKIDAIAEQPAMVVSTGGKTYQVKVNKPVCTLTKNIANPDLDPGKEGDRPCFENPDGDRPVGPDGKPVAVPTACKDQQWDVSASLTADSSGAQVTMLQGLALRVPAQVQCP